MKFIVKKESLEKLLKACFGVVMAKGIDNSKAYPEIDQLLNESIAAAAQRFEGKEVKEEPDILPYRKAFHALSINPNKHLCSIESLFTRITKGKRMPHINPIVDLGNAVSLKHTISMSAHDLGDNGEDARCVISQFSNRSICSKRSVRHSPWLLFGNATSGWSIIPVG